MADLQNMGSKLVDKLLGWVEALVVMMPNLVVAAIAVLAAGFASRWIKVAVYRLLLRMTGNESISRLVSGIARAIVVGISLFLSLELLHLEKTVASLLAGVGVVGLALGFAFQDIAANFMSGFLMALNRPFTVHDLVEVSGHRGRVKEIAFRATTLETLDGLSVLIPNKDVFQNPIVNYNHTPSRRLEFSLGTAYADDMSTVQRVVSEAVANISFRDPSREILVLFDEFGDSSINFSVQVWLDRSDQASYRSARSEALIAIKSALDREKLTIPFPIRTLDFGAGVVGGARLDTMKLRIASTEREAS